MVKKQNCVIWILTYIQKTIDTFIIYIKTDGIYGDIAEDAETSFDTSSYNQIENCLTETIKKESD